MEQDELMEDDVPDDACVEPKYSRPDNCNGLGEVSSTTVAAAMAVMNGGTDNNRNSMTASANIHPAGSTALSGAGTQQTQQQTTQSTPDSTMLRPGNIIMMTLTAEDYENEYWPRLDSAIHQLLALSPGQYAPLSYEQMYSCVYKCVCKQFSERLYQDLLAKVACHLVTLNPTIASDDAKTYIEKFNFALNQYLQALGGIVPIFNYMNRFYVESKLGTDLRKELLKLFKQHVIDHHSTSLLPLLIDAQSKPFMVQPSVMANIVKQLHALCPELALGSPHLFARFIPNIGRPSTESDLDAMIEETRKMQEDLANDPEFQNVHMQTSAKRALD